MSNLIARLPARCALLLALGLLAGCASHAPGTTAKSAPKDAVVTVAPGPHGHRFDMQQNGRKMTAEEFDAWMKAKGIRVATGKPGPATTTAAAAPAPAPAAAGCKVSATQKC